MRKGSGREPEEKRLSRTLRRKESKNASGGK